jgi:hypothetical protein
MKAAKFTPGTRVYYTGDAANASSYGTITRVAPCKWYELRITIKFDNQRFEDDDTRETTVHPFSFSPGPGCRFYLAEEIAWADHNGVVSHRMLREGPTT